MIRMKVLGLFIALPLESLKVDFICRVTNSPIETIQPILDKLVEEGHIKGKRTYKLTGKHLKNFHKNNKLP
jgi:predicted transcriptional regulator